MNLQESLVIRKRMKEVERITTEFSLQVAELNRKLDGAMERLLILEQKKTLRLPKG